MMSAFEIRPKLQTTLRLPRRVVIALPLSMMLGSNRWAAAQTAPYAAPLPRLSYTGIELAPLTVNRAYVDIHVVVDLADDLPTASYMTARPRGMPALQRTDTGAWVAWDERTENLIDNQFESSNGQLLFVVRGADFSRQSFPVELEVAYGTLSGVKFGLLTMLSRR
jgi:hypothetical protein